MTVQWITDGTVGTQQVGLGLSDAELLQRCAGLSLGDPGADDALQACKSQVAGVTGAANNLLADAKNIAGNVRTIVSNYEKELDSIKKFVDASNCGAASTSVSSLEDKFRQEMLPKAERMGEIVSEASSMPQQAFFDAHVSWVEGEVGRLTNEVHTMTDAMGNAIANARAAAEACTGTVPSCPVGSRFDRSSGQCQPEMPAKKKKKSKLGWGLALLAAAAVVGIVKGVG